MADTSASTLAGGGGAAGDGGEVETTHPQVVFLDFARRGRVEDMLGILASEDGSEIDPHSPDVTGSTALHYAALAGHTEAVRMLVEETHADVNVQNRQGDTPLHKAAWKNHVETCQVLVELGADPLIHNEDGDRALDVATSLECKGLLSAATLPEEFVGLDADDLGDDGEYSPPASDSD